MEHPEQLRHLYERYVSNQATRAEVDELFAYIADERYANLLQELMGATWDELKVLPGTYDVRPVESVAPVRKMWGWKQIAVAASVVLVLGFGAYFLVNKGVQQQDEVVAKAEDDVKAPETNRAMITLADGRVVFLDAVDNGQLATEGNVALIKNADGKIAYEAGALAASPGDAQLYHTLSNPRGSKVIDMQLSDGSHVWLNSGSSITYPVAFAGNDRTVSVDGEAYFEVAHDAAKPFVVTKGDMRVQVLGTHFNVNAYSDEPDIKVTLLEGSVKVNFNNHSKVIMPGQQATINKMVQVQEVNTGEVMSWKDGIFLLDNTDLRTLMRQISRWYDVDVVYESKVPDIKFGGGVSKDQPLSIILETLERHGLQFEVTGKTIRVK